MAVEWRTVNGYEGKYEVSSSGDVRSVERTRRGHRGAPTVVRPRVMKANRAAHGYLSLQLCKDGLASTVHVHRIVAEAFVPNPLRFSEVNHKDGVKSNNSASNLEWSSRHGNMRHASKSGLLAVGSRHGNSKLCEEDIPSIRRRFASGESQRQIAHDYGVGSEAIRFVILGRTWRHV